MGELKSATQTASEASTLGWGKRMVGFIACSVVGVVCLILGVYMLFVPLIGLALFTVFHTFGNICAVYSTMFLMEPQKQLTMMFDKTRALATTIMITSLVLTFCAAFWWRSFGLALFFCILQVLSFFWYCLSYIPNLRETIMKMVEICSEILSDSIQFLTELVKLLNGMYEKSPALAVIMGLVLPLCAAFLWPNLGLALLFGALGVLLCSWCNPSFIPFVREAVMKMVEICSEIQSDRTKFLTGLVKQVNSVCDKTTALAVIVGLVLPLCTAFLWPNLGLALLFAALGVLLCSWCNPSFIPFVREAVMKMVEICSEIQSDRTKFLTGLVKQVNSMCDKTTALAVIVGLVLPLCTAFLWPNLGLALLFAALGVLLCSWCNPSFIPFVREAVMKMVAVCLRLVYVEG